MHRYEELEKLYYKNKLKKFFIFLILVVLISGGCFVYKGDFKKNNKNEETKIKVDFKKITNQTETVKPNIINNDINKTSKINVKSQEKNKTKKVKNVFVKEKVEKKEESITPNLSFVIPRIKDYNETEYVSKKHVEKNSNINGAKKKKEEIPTVPIIKEEQINISELIKSFNKNPSYDTAMVISRYYFKNNDLKNAKLWALKANNINPSKYESWKMFALILLKKNDKIKAKEVLKIYLNDYGDNEEIYKLLRSIDE